MPDAAPQHTPTARITRHERQALALILLAFLALAVAHALVTPAWANVEEPGHFEYVRYLVEHRALPDEDSPDEAIRARILDSFVWKHHRWGVGGQWQNALLGDVAWPERRAELSPQPGYEDLTAGGDIPISSSQLGEMPGYYAVAALTQPFVAGASIEAQLLAARLASVLFGLAAVWLAALTARELFPQRRTLRLLIPALVAFLPSFVVLASAVGNTVAAVAALSLAMYAAVRLVRRGFSLVTLALLGAGMLAALLSKTTAYAVLPVALLALPLGFRRVWPRILRIGLPVAAGLAVLLAFTWQRPVSWYPLGEVAPVRDDAPLGQRVLTLVPGGDPPDLWQVTTPSTVKAIAGQTATVGAWVRAPEGDALVRLPTVWAAPNEGTLDLLPDQMAQVEAGPEWAYYTREIAIPEGTQCMSVRVIPFFDGDDPAPVEFDGVTLATGARPDSPPQFASDNGVRGEWGGEAFTNVVLNGSAEGGLPLLRPAIETLLPDRLADTGLKLNRRLSTFFDWRANRTALSQAVRWLFTSFWSRYAWANPGLPRWIVAGLALLTAASLIGLVRFALAEARQMPLWQKRGLALVALAALGVIGIAVFRLDPIRLPWYCDFYQGRFLSTGYYVVPGLMPILALWALGITTLAPPRARRWLAAGLVALFFVLTVGTLLGRQVPDYLLAYGAQPPHTFWMTLWGWMP